MAATLSAPTGSAFRAHDRHADRGHAGNEQVPHEGMAVQPGLADQFPHDLRIVFMARRGIGGLSLGKRVVVDGVPPTTGERSGWSIHELEFAG